MLRTSIFLFFLIGAISNLSCKKDKNDPGSKTGDLTGIVKTTFDQPIVGAIVNAQSVSAVTDEYGRYNFVKLPSGEQTINVTKDGFISASHKVSIPRDATAKLDITLVTGKTQLSISDSIKTISPAGGIFNIKVTSNSTWTVEKKGTWISSSKMSGQGNSSLDIEVKSHAGNDDRSDTLFVVAGEVKRTLVINQSSQIELLSFEGRMGNDETGVKDSVHLQFNKPVKELSIQSLNQGCLTSMNYSIDKKNGATFSYSCANLGGDYPFVVTATDEKGNKTIKSIMVKFFKYRSTITGYITDYIFLNDEKEVLIATFLPATLIRYSIEKGEILETIDLSKTIVPVKLSYSPYDNKVYFMGTSVTKTGINDAHPTESDVYTFNPKTSAIAKAISIPSDPADGPYQVNVPYNIAFTKSGHGMILLKSNQSSAIRWKLIDATKQNQITSYPQSLADSEYFDNLQLNYDQTKILITQTYTGSCNYGVYDGYTQKVKILRPSSVTRSVFITPSKKSNKVYFGQLYDQFIMDLDGKISKLSYLDNRRDGSADFSYRSGEEDYIYFCTNKYLQVLDYSRAVTIATLSMTPETRKFAATVDGKLAVAFSRNSNTTSVFYVYDINSIYRH
jgi:hypothetical protein